MNKTPTKTPTATTDSDTGERYAISPINGARVPLGAHPLNTGGKPGRSGRPPSAVRQALREAFDQRIEILGAIADGAPVQRTRVRLADILPHVACPNCGDQLELRDGADPAREIEVETGATPKDRVQAMDVMARYGLGPLKEVSTEQVREKVGQTIDVIRHSCPPELAVRIIDAMRRVWTA